MQNQPVEQQGRATHQIDDGQAAEEDMSAEPLQLLQPQSPIAQPSASGTLLQPSEATSVLQTRTQLITRLDTLFGHLDDVLLQGGACPDSIALTRRHRPFRTQTRPLA